ncbi:16S rRNA (guanine(966)-N(2))-methyltransferase RsmD, partial [Candidatus Dojkabacteria bacterium]|nr:16S rRNA (guanine(966)-N(2))-methyltransferase RsmD [Candidatus Dojkabacteria bacterium]
ARPVTDRVKTVLFDTIGELIEGSTVLDLFAGSGNLGIEALSRSAETVIFVDDNLEAIETIKSNLKKLDISKNSHKILKLDYISFAKKFKGGFDLIFVDPPFNIQSRVKLDIILSLINREGVIVYKIEEKQKNKIKIPDNLIVVLEKKIGINTLFFLKSK